MHFHDFRGLEKLAHQETFRSFESRSLVRFSNSLLVSDSIRREVEGLLSRGCSRYPGENINLIIKKVTQCKKKGIYEFFVLFFC